MQTASCGSSISPHHLLMNGRKAPSAYHPAEAECIYTDRVYLYRPWPPQIRVDVPLLPKETGSYEGAEGVRERGVCVCCSLEHDE